MYNANYVYTIGITHPQYVITQCLCLYSILPSIDFYPWTRLKLRLCRFNTARIVHFQHMLEMFDMYFVVVATANWAVLLVVLFLPHIYHIGKVHCLVSSLINQILYSWMIANQRNLEPTRFSIHQTDKQQTVPRCLVIVSNALFTGWQRLRLVIKNSDVAGIWLPCID